MICGGTLSILFLLFIHVTYASNEVLFDYNRIDFVELDSIDQLKSRFFNLPNERASTNVVLGVASNDCLNHLESPAFRGIQRFAGGNTIVSVSLPLSQWTYVPINECSQLFFYRFNSSITAPVKTLSDLNDRTITAWGRQTITKTSFQFINHFNFHVALYYHEENKKDMKLQSVLAPGESTQVGTFIGHIFVAYHVTHFDDDDTPLPDVKVDPMVDFLVVSETSYILSPSNRLETCEYVTAGERSQAQHEMAMISFEDVGHGQLACDNLPQRLTIFSHRVWYHKRLGLNYVQPKVVRPVTHNGFFKRPLPAETYAWLRQWYDEQQRIHEIQEHSVGPCMNQVGRRERPVTQQHFLLSSIPSLYYSHSLPLRHVHPLSEVFLRGQ